MARARPVEGRAGSHERCVVSRYNCWTARVEMVWRQCAQSLLTPGSPASQSGTRLLLAQVMSRLRCHNSACTQTGGNCHVTERESVDTGWKILLFRQFYHAGKLQELLHLDSLYGHNAFKVIESIKIFLNNPFWSMSENIWCISCFNTTDALISKLFYFKIFSKYLLLSIMAVCLQILQDCHWTFSGIYPCVTGKFQSRQ